MKINLLENKEFKKFRFQSVILVFTLLLSISAVHAQKVTVKGVVSGSGDPLPGASVAVKGAKNGTVTDFDGNYVLKVNPGKILVFSYLGFASKEVKIGSNKNINVSLEPDVAALDEIIVVGYGTQKKKEVTGAVVQVKAEDLAKTTTADIGSALQGQISGVNVTASSGAPGEGSNILIRGFSSLLDGQNGPLFVVDGIPFDSDPGLSISEIESVDVLKDAASASIYGTRGAGGVILITTKKGKEGQMNIRVNTEYGIQNITSQFHTMSTAQISYFNLTKAYINSGKVKGGVEYEITRNRSYLTNDTDIKQVLLNDNAAIQNHSVNLSGGKAGLTYSLNMNYFGQKGVVYNSNLDRFNIRANTQFVTGKWKFVTGINFRRDQKLVPLSNMVSRIFDYKVFRPLIDLDDSSLPNATEVGTDDPDNDWRLNDARQNANNIRAFKTEEKHNTNITTGNIQVEYNITKALKATARLGATYSNRKETKIAPRFDIFNTNGDLITNPLAITSHRVVVTDNSKLTSEEFLNYNKKFGKHSLNLLLGTSFERSTQERLSLEVRNNINSAITVIDNYEIDYNIESGGRDYTRTLIGNIARVNYNFDGKYLISASGRYDGSSMFSDGKKWGFFPSASVGWNISDENFWDPMKSVVNSFKFRAGVGTTGNDRFALYSNQSVVEPGANYIFGTKNASSDLANPSGETTALGTTQLEYANADLRWETKVETNFGFDLGLFKNKLTLSSDFYRSEIKDLLYPVVNSPSSGVSGNYRSTVFNIGNMRNSGIEYAANYKHRGRNSGLNWSVSGTYTSNDNVVTKTADNNPIVRLDNSYISTGGTRELVSVLKEGYEAAAFFLRETDGVIKTQEQLEEYKKISPGAQMGEFMYIDQLTVDTNGDGIPDKGDGEINDDDKVYSGSGTPDWEGGLNLTADYKGFDLSMQWYGAFGGKVMNGTKAYAYQRGVHRDLVHSWTEVNTEADIPWHNGNNSTSYRGGSSYFLEDGDFVRLRNVAIGYSLSKKALKSIGLSKFRIYVQGQNLLTFTEYTGFDPEVGGNGLSTRGIDRGRYPVSSQYKLGLQLQF
ncbi:TonB-dependent receptor [Polaribacter sp. Q13]|uniref:SusC/RagA family TonB-linked outer membrane protein n=1 Tax=Polaribacter sp. Q13 TaxID=2806551 RepID=UPI00193B7772|nr:TonB-dependent receptor [Polaribacter sp. Q13]QVY66042.1 TonB-dependent receptor [Polaribacter sp. Q13]